MTWERFLAAREQLRAAALSAARALLEGREEPASALLGAPRLCAHPLLRAALLRAITTVGPLPPGELGARLEAPDRLPEPEGENAPADLDFEGWNHWLAERVSLADTPVARVAWTLERLARVGIDEEDDRRAHAAATWVSSTDDARFADTWRLLIEGARRGPGSGALWNGLERAEKALLPQARRVFAAVVTDGIRGPIEKRRKVLEDLTEGYLPQLAGSPRQGVGAGWRDIALRVLETVGDDPVVALAGHLGPSGWKRLARGAARRGATARTVRRLFLARDPEIRAIQLEEWLGGDPSRLGALLDFHVRFHLIHTWSRRPEATRLALTEAIVRQQRGRANGRIRAIALAEDPPMLGELPGLAERSRFAARRHAWAWAWAQVRLDFPFSAFEVTRPCVLRPPASLPATSEALACTWFRYATLSDARALVDRWCAGLPFARGERWFRLRSVLVSAQEKPPLIRRYLAPVPVRERLDRALRASLAGPWPRYFRRALAEEILGRLRPDWHSAVPMPRPKTAFDLLQRWNDHG